MKLIDRIKKIQEIRKKDTSYYQYVIEYLEKTIRYSEYIAENIK